MKVTALLLFACVVSGCYAYHFHSADKDGWFERRNEMGESYLYWCTAKSPDDPTCVVAMFDNAYRK